MKNRLKYLLHAAIFVGVVYAGFKYLNGDDIWSAIKSFNYIFMPFMLLLATVYLVIKSWRFAVLLAPVTEGLNVKVAMRAYAAGQAATLLPGGIAARAGLLKQADVPIDESSVPIVFSSVLDQAVFVAAALVAAIFFDPARTPAFIILGVLVALGLLSAIPAVRKGFLKLTDWSAERFNAKDDWRDFLANVTEIFTWPVMFKGLGLTVIGFVLEVIVLDLAIRGVSQSVNYSTLFLAYTLPTMLGRLSGLPAGLGVTEAGMVGFFASFSPLGTAAATAATAIFRIATVFFRALLGAAVYALAWRGDKEDAEDSEATQVA